MTTTLLLSILVLLVFTLLVLILLKFQGLKDRLESGQQAWAELPSFGKSLGKVEKMADDLNHMEERISRRLKEYEQKIDPLKSNMDGLINYFGGLKSGAGKVGELALDLVLENYPEAKIMRHCQLDNGTTVEFVLQIGDQWVSLDNKLTSDPKKYLKREIPKASQYLGRRIVAGKGDRRENLGEIRTADYGLISVLDEETFDQVMLDVDLRHLMVEHQVWVVSPNSFYWQIFLLDWVARESVKAEDARGFLSQVRDATRQLESAVRHLGTMEKHMENSRANADTLREELQKSLQKLKGSELK